MNKIFNPIYGVIFFILGFILILFAPPLYNGNDYTFYHYIVIGVILLGILHLIISLIRNGIGK